MSIMCTLKSSEDARVCSRRRLRPQCQKCLHRFWIFTRFISSTRCQFRWRDPELHHPVGNITIPLTTITWNDRLNPSLYDLRSFSPPPLCSALYGLVGNGKKILQKKKKTILAGDGNVDPWEEMPERRRVNTAPQNSVPIANVCSLFFFVSKTRKERTKWDVTCNRYTYHQYANDVLDGRTEISSLILWENSRITLSKTLLPSGCILWTFSTLIKQDSSVPISRMQQTLEATFRFSFQIQQFFTTVDNEIVVSPIRGARFDRIDEHCIV